MRRLALIAVLAALALPGLAKEPEPTATAPAAPVPQPIPLPALVFEAESAERFARSVAKQVEPSRELARIDAALANLTPELRQLSAEVVELTRGVSAIVALDSTAHAVDLASERLAGWQKVPTRQLVALERTLEEIAEQGALWDRTREAALEARAPPEALARIEAVRAALRHARRDALVAQRGLVELQARIARQEAIAREAIDALGAAQLGVRASLLTRDSPALWNAFSRRTATSPTRVLADVRTAGAYVAESWQRIAAQLALFGFLAGLAVRLRGRAGHLHEDPRLVASAIIFDRPASSAALLVIAFNPALHPNAPPVALLPFWLIAILAVVRVLPGLVDAALKPVIWAVATLATLDALGVALASFTVLERVICSLKLALATAALVWLMRPVRLALVPDPAQLPRFLQPLLQLARGAFAAAFLASVLGWSNLAHLVGDGTLRSAYAALLIYPAARVLRAGLRATVRSNAFSRVRLFRDHAESVIATGARIVNAAGLIVWSVRTLDGFGLWQAVLELGSAIWGLQIGFGSLSLTLGDVLTFGLTIWASLLLARFARFVLEGGVVARFDPRRGVANAVGATAQYLLLLVGFFVAATASGIDMSRFTLLAGAFGVGVGFGMQNIINNFVSGLILLYERPIQVGDTIEVGAGVTGEVQRIGVRSSALRTPEGAHVIVPNASLIAEQVTNWTHADRTRRVDLRVGVAYGSAPARVIELLLGCARAHRGVLVYPPPMALFVGFADSALNFELRIWTGFEEFVVVRSEVGLAVHDALAAAGIAIPFPQLDLHLRPAAPEAASPLSSAPSSRNPAPS